MSRSAELWKFLQQLRITDLIDFVVVWAIIYGLLKLVRGTRAVQMVAGCSDVFRHMLARWLPTATQIPNPGFVPCLAPYSVLP